MKSWRYLLPLLLVAAFLQLDCSAPDRSLFGTWELVPEKSTDLVTWRYRKLQLEIHPQDDDVVILHNWRDRNRIAFVDSIVVVPGQKTSTAIAVDSPIWPENWYMGVLAKTGVDRLVSGEWIEPGRELSVTIEQLVEISQGEKIVHTHRLYRIDRRGKILKLVEQRSTRPTPIELVFRSAVNE
ncbi:hypothetical protein JW992_06200 [candidate division KSB1 bacterium]|nr:hypothetical protein [candidate division KSB1 bacterium]